MYTLKTSLSQISYLAPKIIPQLKKLALHTIEDLLWHVPFRYKDWSIITPIGNIIKSGNFCIRARIVSFEVRKVWKRNLTLIEGILQDETGTVQATWFNQHLIIQMLRVGDEAVFCGKFVKKGAKIITASPQYEKLTSRRTRENLIHTGRIVPYYRLTAGITQKQLRALLWHTLENLPPQDDPHPPDLIKKEKLLDFDSAIRGIHFPRTPNMLKESRQRLAFDELFDMHKKIFSMRANLEKSASIKVPFLQKETQKFVHSLPFELTASQKKAAWEILQDMSGTRVMSRLLNGDVGSGKTVVVAIAMLGVALNNLQSVFLCPTEVLARQHFNTLCLLFRDFTTINIALYTRTNQLVQYPTDKKPTKVSKSKLKKEIQSGKIHIIVGTHALLASENYFSSLALAVVDEQHRFGVKQRSWLRAHAGIPGIIPHFLSISATPIPRTLFLAFFADLDVSTIYPIPQKRKKVQTIVFSKHERVQVYERIYDQITKGHQAFIICPFVSESDALGVKSVENEYKRIQQEGVFSAGVTFGKLHGKLKPAAKEAIMRDFQAGIINILISTSVIEVGIDVPNATIILIEDPQRFGLAQLHQFRGRVGRGSSQAYCLLISDTKDLNQLDRIRYFCEISDGFELAQKDLQLRGGGDIDGIRQSGLPAFKVARWSDFSLSERARTRVYSKKSTG